MKVIELGSKHELGSLQSSKSVLTLPCRDLEPFSIMFNPLIFNVIIDMFGTNATILITIFSFCHLFCSYVLNKDSRAVGFLGAFPANTNTFTWESMGFCPYCLLSLTLLTWNSSNVLRINTFQMFCLWSTPSTQKLLLLIILSSLGIPLFVEGNCCPLHSTIMGNHSFFIFNSTFGPKGYFTQH